MTLEFIEVRHNPGLVVSPIDLLESFNKDLSFSRSFLRIFVTNKSGEFTLSYSPNKARVFSRVELTNQVEILPQTKLLLGRVLEPNRIFHWLVSRIKQRTLKRITLLNQPNRNNTSIKLFTQVVFTQKVTFGERKYY